MQQISTLFKENGFQIADKTLKNGVVGKYKAPSERGELLSYFSTKLHKKIPYVAFKLTGFTIQDMYYLRSSCDQAEHRGIPWGAAFYSSIKINV